MGEEQYEFLPKAVAFDRWPFLVMAVLDTAIYALFLKPSAFENRRGSPGQAG